MLSQTMCRCWCWGLVMAVGALLLASCTRHGAAGDGRPIHSQAAQRIDLAPGAVPGVGASAALGPTPARTAPEEVHLPDGTVGIKVSQQYFHTIVVCRQGDGTYSMQCPAAPAAPAAPR